MWQNAGTIIECTINKQAGRWNQPNLLLGIFFVLPCIESYQKVDLRTITLGVPPQEVGWLQENNRKAVGSFALHFSYLTNQQKTQRPAVLSCKKGGNCCLAWSVPCPYSNTLLLLTALILQYYNTSVVRSFLSIGVALILAKTYNIVSLDFWSC